MAFHMSDVAKFILCVMLVANVEIWSVEGLLKLPPNVKIPAVFVFGDSLVDTGNNNNIMSIVKANFPPYGINFKGGLPTGRFTDGKVISDFMAEELGIKDILPAYLDPKLPPQELITGVTFASGGAGYDPFTSQLGLVISLSQQLKYFEECIGKLKAMVGRERAKFIVENSIYFVVAGSDDLANSFFNFRIRKIQYDIHAYTALVLEHASKFVEELYNLGARRIGVANVPPIGCVPAQKTMHGGILRHCAENQNEAASLFNSKLSSKLSFLNATLPNSRIVYVDIYKPLLELRETHRQLGFKEMNRGCCGTGLIEVSVLCNRLTPVTCSNVSKYVFFDSFHPTSAVQKILVSQVLSKCISQFF